MRQKIFIVLFAAGMCALFLRGAHAEEFGDFNDLSLNALLNRKVYSASKYEQKLIDAPNALYVITREDIRRSGAVSLPDLFRRVPGVDVANVHGGSFGVSARGLNSRFASRMLVLVDGRSIYNSVFGGVYWEQNTVFLEDIERIEVIRGPGATMWGTNAVNGVINIITRDPEERQEAFVKAQAGTRRYRETVARCSATPAEELSIALTAGYAQDDGSRGVNDFQRSPRVSGRLKYRVSDSTVLHAFAGLSNADIRTDNSAIIRAGNFDAPGGYGMLRLEHEFSPASELELQVSYDYGKARNEDLLLVREKKYEFNLQHSFAPGDKNRALWGITLRQVKDSSDYLPAGSATDSLTSFFLQDELSLRDNLKITGGVRFENNYATEGKWSPRGCILYTPVPDHHLRFSIAKAYRTPSFTETKISGRQPFFETGGLDLVRAAGNQGLAPEQMTAYELGYRTILFSRLGLNIELYHNNLENVIRTVLEQPGIPVQLSYDNTHSITSRGVEVQLDLPLRQWWNLSAGYTYQDVEQKALDAHRPGTPRHKFSLLSRFSFKNGLMLE